MSLYIPVELRRRVYERAKGQCEYCLIPETLVLVPHEIDHIIAQKHGGPTEFENLALSCTICNKYKGSDLASLDPATGDLVPLYHPRQDRWQDHFCLHDAQIIPLTPTGRVTVHLLQFNSPERIEERELFLRVELFQSPK